jgi:predicted Zn finger-like uncharacterized protein
MKFLCGNCKAKYQIADEKVSGRTLRMKCRRCGHDILIDGHNASQSNPPQPSPAPRRGGASGNVSVLPTPRGGSGAHAMPSRGGAAIAAAPALPRPVARSKPPTGLNADFRRHVAAPPEVPQRSAPYDLWHVAIQDVPVGPMTRDELARKIDAGAVSPDSLCWREGMDDWRPLGELPELAQLLRRPRDASRPLRGRAAPAPAARPSPAAFDVEDPEDEGAEPTRVSDFMPPVVQGSQAGPMPHQPHPLAAGSSPRILVPAAASSPSGGDAAPPLAPARSGLDRTAMLALGLLGGILLVGGPMLYRNTWGAPDPQAIAPTVAPAPVERARPATPDPVDLTLEATPEKAPEVNTPAQRTGTKGVAARPKAEGEKPANGKSLSGEQLALLKRMGGGGNDPDLSGMRPKNEDQPSGPVAATLNQAQLTKVVKDNTVQLQRCYETALRAAGGKQDAAIKVTVSVVVGMSGTTKSVSTQGDGLGNMTDCIRQSVKRWRFPVSGGDSEFAFPLVFQPGA